MHLLHPSFLFCATQKWVHLIFRSCACSNPHEHGGVRQPNISEEPRYLCRGFLLVRKIRDLAVYP